MVPAGRTCTQNDLDTIDKCYVNTVFRYFKVNVNPFDFYEYYGAYINAVQNFSQIPDLCNMKKSFDLCVGTAAFQNCFDIYDFQNVKFLQNTNDRSRGLARSMIANYMQSDLACGSAYEVVTQKLYCVFKYGSNCEGDYDSCSNSTNSYINCVVPAVTENCGKAAGCAAKKYLSLQRCYASDCDFCANLDYNNNPIKNMCSEDSGHPDESNANIITLNKYVSTFLFTILYFFL
uniref:Uncharacterized protein n=1 Tax=Panagrolaimus davidi TaxID=227884 RepID=A0A914PV45_9BILA